ncbi:unnamed protein product, partial [Pylaiella littoralis]
MSTSSRCRPRLLRLVSIFSFLIYFKWLALSTALWLYLSNHFCAFFSSSGFFGTSSSFSFYTAQAVRALFGDWTSPYPLTDPLRPPLGPPYQLNYCLVKRTSS